MKDLFLSAGFTLLACFVYQSSGQLQCRESEDCIKCPPQQITVCDRGQCDCQSFGDFGQQSCFSNDECRSLTCPDFSAAICSSNQCSCQGAGGEQCQSNFDCRGICRVGISCCINGSCRCDSVSCSGIRPTFRPPFGLGGAKQCQRNLNCLLPCRRQSQSQSRIYCCINGSCRCDRNSCSGIRPTFRPF